MKNLHLLLIALVIAFPLTGEAGVTRKGVTKCGKWVQERSDGRASNSEFWLLGYLSGIAVGKQIDFMENSDAASNELWMDKYCRNNPLDSVGDGADVLAKELARRMR